MRGLVVGVAVAFVLTACSGTPYRASAPTPTTSVATTTPPITSTDGTTPITDTDGTPIYEPSARLAQRRVAALANVDLGTVASIAKDICEKMTGAHVTNLSSAYSQIATIVNSDFPSVTLDGTDVNKIAAIYCSSEEPVAVPPTTAPAPTAPPAPALTYEVQGSGSALVTYAQSGFGQAQQTVQLPWTYSPSDLPTYPDLIAQLQGSGTITCIILENGAEVTRNSSSGQYVIASCSSS